jgi:hypothetical protein
MATFPNPTTGVGVAANILIAGTENSGDTTPGLNDVVLSLSGAGGNPESFQLNPQIVDAEGNPVDPGTAFTLSAVAASSGDTAVYTGTITGGGSNAFAGKTFVVAGFAAANNNGTFICTASSATTLTLENAGATAVTAAGTATEQETTNSLTYSADGSASYTQGTYNPGTNPTRANVVSVSASGNITTNGVTGGSVVEVAYPAFNGGNVATGKVYAEVNVTVVE